jgi:hypothetical protein
VDRNLSQWDRQGQRQQIIKKVKLTIIPLSARMQAETYRKQTMLEHKQSRTAHHAEDSSEDS